MYTYTWYQWLAFFLCILLFRVDFRIDLCFPETETARQPRISAASDAAALRFRRGDDALGVPAGAGQPAARLYFRFYRRHGA